MVDLNVVIRWAFHFWYGVVVQTVKQYIVGFGGKIEMIHIGDVRIGGGRDRIHVANLKQRHRIQDGNKSG